MPEYHITIHMKMGPPRKGTRYFSSHDLERVRALVAQKVRETIGNFLVEKIEVEMVPEDKKNLYES